MSKFRCIISRLLGRVKGYDKKIIIHLGINASSNREAQKEAEEIAETVKILTHDFLVRFPYRMEIK